MFLKWFGCILVIFFLGIGMVVWGWRELWEGGGGVKRLVSNK